MSITLSLFFDEGKDPLVSADIALKDEDCIIYFSNLGDWELEIQNLLVEYKVGAGAFATVWKGALREVPAIYRSRLRLANDSIAVDGSIIVAVKMPTKSSDATQV